MIYKVKNTEYTIRSIVHDVISGKEASTIISLGYFESIYRKLRLERERSMNPKPYRFEEIGFPTILTRTIKGEEFYRYGPGNFVDFPQYTEFSLFFSDTMAESLKNEDNWCVDGTFYIVPRPYYQLVTISILVNGTVSPVIFALLHNKQRVTYNNLFEIIKLLIPNLCLIRVKVYFEIALIKAFEENFPEADISGCSFHLTQAIMRKISTKGLITSYRKDPVFRMFTRMIMCLIYVRADKVEETFDELVSIYEFPEDLVEIAEYFRVNYIRGQEETRFPISLWNYGTIHSRQIPRSNNAIEGWHSAFKNVFLNNLKSFLYLIKMLIKEEDKSRINLIRC